MCVADFILAVPPQMFPKDWCVLHMTINKVILNTLTELAIPLRDRFLEGKHFSQQVHIAREARILAATSTISSC